MVKLRKLIIILSLILVLMLSACSSTTIKYQCNDGTIKDSADLCGDVSLESCPQLDCNLCPVKTETKVETKTITEKIYVCSDLSQVKSLNDCKTEEQKNIDSSSYALIITINDARTTRYISDYSLDDLNSNEEYLIVDFSLYNKGISDGYDFNPNFVLVEDSDSYSYDYSWDSSSLSKYFPMVEIGLNEKKSGELAFVVPKDETEFTLIIKDIFGSTKSKKTFIVN